MRARSQHYAEAIYDLVQAVPKRDQARYGALCHRFPLIVLENGLVAAFGFLAAKGKEDASPEALLLDHYAKVLGLGDADGLRAQTVSASLVEYRHLTRRALMAAEWFKRYAEAVLKVDATGMSEQAGEGSSD